MTQRAGVGEQRDRVRQPAVERLQALDLRRLSQKPGSQ